MQNPSGYPIMRFAAAPYLMGVCGLIFTGFGVFEWFDPRNHQYSGNLPILCYAPILLGIFCFLFTIFLASYVAVLQQNTIKVTRWPFGTAEFHLDQWVSIEDKGKQTFLRFRDGRTLPITHMLSGSAHFIQCVKASLADKHVDGH